MFLCQVVVPVTHAARVVESRGVPIVVGLIPVARPRSAVRAKLGEAQRWGGGRCRTGERDPDYQGRKTAPRPGERAANLQGRGHDGPERSGRSEEGDIAEPTLASELHEVTDLN